jgi:hypothetical protein
VNESLRLAAEATEDTKAMLHAQLHEFSPYIDTLTSGLNFLQRQDQFKGVAYRGLRLPALEIEKYHELQESGKPYKSAAFMSTTLDKESAQAFEEGSPNNVALVIELSSGAYLGPLSQADTEEEILVSPNALFKVKNIEPQAFGSGTDVPPKVVIHLQQV